MNRRLHCWRCCWVRRRWRHLNRWRQQQTQTISRLIQHRFTCHWCIVVTATGWRVARCSICFRLVRCGRTGWWEKIVIQWCDYCWKWSIWFFMRFQNGEIDREGKKNAYEFRALHLAFVSGRSHSGNLTWLFLYWSADCCWSLASISLRNH